MIKITSNLVSYSLSKAAREYLKALRYSFSSNYDYIHIPKSGGKFIKGFCRYNNISNITLHGHIITPRILPNRKRFLVSIRDPFDRLVSSYYSAKINKEKTGVSSKRLDKFYNQYPTVELFLHGFIKNEEIIDLNLQCGLFSTLSYWFDHKFLDRQSRNISVLRVSHLQEDLTTFIIDNIHYIDVTEESFTYSAGIQNHTNKSHYEIDGNLKQSVKSCLSNDYSIYNRLLQLGQ